VKPFEALRAVPVRARVVWCSSIALEPREWWARTQLRPIEANMAKTQVRVVIDRYGDSRL
jgi:hypothetical protein